MADVSIQIQGHFYAGMTEPVLNNLGRNAGLQASSRKRMAEGVWEDMVDMACREVCCVGDFFCSFVI